MNLGTAAECTILHICKPDKIPALRRNKSYPQPKSYLEVIRSVKQKISFRQWTVTGHTNHTSGQASCPERADQHKKDSMKFSYSWAFCCFLVYFFVMLAFCLLVSLLCLDLLLLFVFEIRNRKSGKQGGREHLRTGEGERLSKYL